MTFNQKVHAVKCASRCEMETSKVVCVEDACELFEKGKFEYADKRLEKAASYAWGFSRPEGWTSVSEDE